LCEVLGSITGFDRSAANRRKRAGFCSLHCRKALAVCILAYLLRAERRFDEFVSL